MAKGKIVWVESQADPRWENRNYSVIKIMYLKNKETTLLTRNTRYMSASISPDGSLIAAAENTPENKNNIVFIDPDDGSVIQSIPAPGNAYLQRPQWAESGAKLTAISLTEAGEGILSYSPDTRQWETLVEPGRNDLQSSYLKNDTLFFVSSSSGTDNLYFLTPDKKLAEVTNSEFGANDLCINGQKALFTDYSSSGNKICSLVLGQSIKNVRIAPGSSSFLINRTDSVQPTSGERYNSDFSPVPYRKWQHLFNFHSWMPFYADLQHVQTDPASIRPGFTVMSQNHLSTLISSLGYEYSSDKRHKLHTRITWKGWYPVIESQLDYGNKPVIDKLREPVNDPLSVQQGIRFINTASLPLRFTPGKFTQFLYPSFTTDYSNNYIFLKELNRYDYGQTQLTARLYFSNSIISSVRDIYPRWAQVFDLKYSFSPFDKAIYGSSESVKTAFYFPGIFPNNSIRMRLEKEKQKLVKYYIGNKIDWPRGYQNIFSENLNFLSLDYAIPLFYPDFNIPGIIYVKRIRGTLFYDFARGKGNAYFMQTGSGTAFQSYHDYFESFKSFGFELLTDFHLFRNPFMISAGVQGSWQSITASPLFELLFNIDIFGMNIGKSRL